MSVAYISHADVGFHDTGWGHPEHVGRIRAIPRALRDDPELFGALMHVEAIEQRIDDPRRQERPRGVMDQDPLRVPGRRQCFEAFAD